MTEKSFPIVILAGGLATRLHPVTETIPKALIPLQDEPFIHHQLRLLKKNGIKEVVLAVGFLGEMIEEQIGDGKKFNLHIQYVYDSPTLLGTGGAIKKAQPLLGDNFFILYGDSYLTCDYRAIQQAFMQGQSLALMTVLHNQGLWDKSNIQYADGKILIYDKKTVNQAMQHIDYGLGIMNKAALTYLPNAMPYDLASLYQTLLSMNQLEAYEVKERFYEVGSFAGIKELEYYLAEQKQ